MFKLKGANPGIVAALATAALLVSGLAITTTVGAGTDVSAPPAGFNFTMPDDTTDPGTGTGTDGANPPASPVEQPAAADDIDPSGAPGASGLGPNALPSAGYGQGAGNSLVTAVVIAMLAGITAIGAGSMVQKAGRRDS
jgi:hypothetical protein